MTARRKPSVAGLTRQLAAAHAETDRVRRLFNDEQGARNADLQAHATEVCARDTEAVAVDGCVKALDKLITRGQYDSRTMADQLAVARVLRYLATRYNIPDAAGELDHLRRREQSQAATIVELEARLAQASDAVAGRSSTWLSMPSRPHTY